eukprot:TRINITY_DN4016_c0_g1_i3.p1 TRINITY_DN4016_c0_g1~~TRINITY_DN4016_c0_g1_i3.p1  ORF type:complete len:206 (-),score=63.12 TRINITY_DN4016_c0_g1_i3:59-676(-)
MRDLNIQVHTRKWRQSSSNSNPTTPKVMEELKMSEEERQRKETETLRQVSVAAQLRQKEACLQCTSLFSDEYFAAPPPPPNTPKSAAAGLLYPSEFIVERVKSFKGTVWLTDEFPRPISDFLPIFEVLAPSNKHFEKLSNFITSNLLPHGDRLFPVKLEMPVFPTICGTVTFLRYEECPVDASLFDVPDTFASAVVSGHPQKRHH